MNPKRILLISLVILSLMVGANSVYGAGGDVLWEKTINFSPDYPHIYNKYLAVSSTLCIVYGQASQGVSPTGQIIGFIKAYDMATGNPKWERTLTFGTKNYHQLILDRDVVYISSTSESPNKYTLGAYNANTGQTIWEKITDINIDNIAYLPVPLANNMVCTLGVITTANGSSIILKVYQAQSISTPAANSLLLEN